MTAARSHHFVLHRSMFERLGNRWIGVATAIGFAATLLVATVPPAPADAVPPVPKVAAGQGPVERPMPAGVRSAEAVDEEARPPVVPEGVRAGGEPVAVPDAEWRTLTRLSTRAAEAGDPADPAAPAGIAPTTGPAPAAADDAAVPGSFTNLDLRPGFLLGDTSVVLYFDADDVNPDWTAAVVRLYERDSQEVQASTRLTREDLESPRACGVHDFCRSFGRDTGWDLTSGERYFVTVAAVVPGGDEIVSDPSAPSAPRRTILPPEIPEDQAAGCGCENALSPTAVAQAKRGVGVNTGTGSFVRVERDLQMASFGIPFASVRTYSSANNRPGPLGVGWAWTYDMSVTRTDDGVIVRAEDGAEALYTPDGDGYRRPPGVRSELRRAGDGWDLVTPQQVRYRFAASGRLTAILGPRDDGVRLSYDEDRVTVTDASGHEANVFLEDGLIRTIALPDHRRVQFWYENDLLTTARDARGELWRYGYDDAGRLATVTDPDKRVTLRNTYGDDDRVVSQRDGAGAEMTFDWYPARQEARTVDADGVQVWDGYRGNVLIYSQRGTGDADNHRYNGRLDRNLVVNGNQYQHTVRYDGKGNPTRAVAPQGFDERTKYDDRNNPVEYTDANGNVWKNTYNEFNELVRSVDAEGHQITHAYDDRGLLTSSTDQRGKITRYEYYPEGDENAGLLHAAVTPEGRRTEVGYDRTGRQVWATDPRGVADPHERRDYTTWTRYDDQDRVVEVQEPGKHHPWRTLFDDVGRLAKEITPEGATTSYAYHDNGMVERVAQGPRVVSYKYTTAGRRAAERVHMTHTDDLVTSYTYDAKGLVKTVTSPRGNVPGANRADFTTTYFYDANDNLVRLRMPYPGSPGYVDRDIRSDALDRTTATVNELNRQSTFERDNLGQVASTTDTRGRTTTMRYDKTGLQTRRTDPAGKTTRTEYDAAGNKIKEISPTGGITTWRYTDDGLLASVTEPRGNVAGADPGRFTTRYEYDLAGNLTAEIDPLGNTTRYEYDATNRVVATSDAKGNTTHVNYREDDQVSHVRAPDAPDLPAWSKAFATVLEYDRDGLMTGMRDPEGGRTHMDYDEAGRPTTSTDPLGRTTHVTYDAESNVTASLTVAPHERLDEAERAARTITSTYDLRNRLTAQQVGAQGPRYTFGYDAKDRTVSYGDPLGVRNVTYDAEDQITKVVRDEATGPDETFTYGYDQRGNITRRTYPDGTQIRSTYDADSRPISTTASGGSAGATPATWRYAYDVAGRRTATTLPSPTGLVEEREYDDAGRLTRIGTEWTGGAPPDGVQDPVSDFRLTLDAVGNPERVLTTRGGVTESVAYAYDEANRVTDACYGAKECGWRSEDAGRIAYDYDLLGNRTSQKRTGEAGHDFTRYSYDRASQLVKEITIGEGPDEDREEGEGADADGRGAGDEKDAPDTKDTAEAKDSADAQGVAGRTASSGIDVTTYEYDVLGNQIRAGDDRLTYNLDNTLRSATVDGQTTTYQYDAGRMRLTAQAGFGQDATTRRFSWDTNGTIENLAVDTLTGANGQVLGRQAFAYGPTDEPLALLDQATGAHTYTHDWLGSVVNMLSPGGQVEEGYDYDPFGQPREGETLEGTAQEGAALAEGDDGGEPTASPSGTPGAAPSAGASPGVAPNADDAGAAAAPPVNPMRFTGAYQDSSTGEGNYFMRARNYDPGTGRFSSVDPLGAQPPGSSPYVYAANNPLVYTDPTGEMAMVNGGGGGAPGGTPTAPGQEQPPGPSAEDVAEAQQLQNKSVLDVVLEAGGQILMEVFGVNDVLNCLKGDIGACAMVIVGALPWGKIFKAPKIIEAVWNAGKAVIRFFEELKWAKQILAGAKKAADAAAAAKAAAAKAAREAAAKAAKAKEAAKAKAKQLAEAAKRQARQDVAKKKASTTGQADGAAKKDPSPGCQTNSFVAGTRVLMADGTTKPIEDVEPGDKVRTADEVTAARTGAQLVTAHIRGSGEKTLVTITVKDADGDEQKLVATDGHPFWDPAEDAWVDAIDLRSGSWLKTSAGTWVQVAAAEVERTRAVVHNLRVASEHTYFVGVADDSVLVHNCGKEISENDVRDLLLVSRAGYDTVSAGRGTARVTAAAAYVWNPRANAGQGARELRYAENVPGGPHAEDVLIGNMGADETLLGIASSGLICNNCGGIVTGIPGMQFTGVGKARKPSPRDVTMFRTAINTLFQVG
ncbi:polymorphic toxin-type HINT domain-containing protein [Myceligenerans crystallogenes]|uniref:RHS repeat-associated core domain-containing protein n=1 Tax=Myceligenerans crystallogenes TaxID=316335 RepID=A0ABN2N8V3_9MICO